MVIAISFPVFSLVLHQLETFPEYLLALKGSLSILIAGLPLYLGLRYFLYKRKLTISLGVTFNFIGAFILFAGLAFLLASPLASHLPESLIRAYLFGTCVVAALGVVSLIDVFFLQYYLVQLKQIYVSPPLRAVVKMSIFILAILPILRFVLHFNPLALVAIPTIATAGLALALQDTLKTFIAGIALGHIVRLGQWISFEGREGRVIDLNWARTTLMTINGETVYIPNTLLQAGIFQNFSAARSDNRQTLQIGASYDVPPARVKDVLVRSVDGVPGMAVSPPPQAVVLEYGESAVIYTLHYWINDYAQRVQIRDDIATRVWYAFRREGITIPFPTRTVQMERVSEIGRKERLQVEQELKRWNLAEAFYNEELQELSQFTHKNLYAPGEVIVLKGAPGASLFTIVSGDVDILTGDLTSKPVATLGPKDIFGEMSLLTGEPRSATVRARSSVEVLEIDKPGMQQVIAKRPELSEKLADLVAKRLADSAAASHPEKSTTAPLKTESSEKLSQRIRHFFGLS